MRRLFIILGLSLLSWQADSANFRDGSLTYLYGDNFKVEPAKQQTITFEYAAAWDFMDIFLFVDFKDFDNRSGRYGEFSPRFKLAEFDQDHWLKQISFSTTFERGKNDVASNLLGVGFDFNLSNFRYLKTNLYHRDDPDISGNGYQMTTVWAFDVKLGDMPILIDGFYDWTFNSDEQQDNLHFNPQIKIDMQAWQGGQYKWYLGVEYDYWHNKFGIKDSPTFDTEQNTISLLAKWHF